MPDERKPTRRHAVLKEEVIYESGAAEPSTPPPARKLRSGTARGTVIRWSDDEGWGVIASEDLPGEVWAHAMHIEGEGYRTLHVGEVVEFDWHEMSVTGGQDGYSYRASSVRRSA